LQVVKGFDNSGIREVLSETVEKGQANHSIKRPISIPKIY